MSDPNAGKRPTPRPYFGGGRKPTGQLVWRKSGWAARFWAIVDGVKVRVTRDLATKSKAVARRKLARLLESESPTPAEAARVESFEEAALRIVAVQKAEGLRTWGDRLGRLRRFAFAELGHMQVTEIRPGHVREVLDGCVSQGKSRSTVHQLKVDISSVLGELWRDEVLPENVAVRAGAEGRHRRRARTGDSERRGVFAVHGVRRRVGGAAHDGAGEPNLWRHAHE